MLRGDAEGLGKVGGAIRVRVENKEDGTDVPCL